MVDCRRILKWTYAYGYYRFGEGMTGTNGATLSPEVIKQQQQFFEFNQVRRIHRWNFHVMSSRPKTSAACLCSGAES